MVVRINPWVSLHVIRIEDGVSYMPGGASRTINPTSAARAIDAAITRDVDIISMSWTINDPRKRASILAANQDLTSTERKKSPEELAIKPLQEAIDKAVEKNIIMFCSAADDIQLVGRDTLPFSGAPNHIIRIGSATPQSQRDPASGDAKSISYFLPGNQVAEAQRPHSTKPLVYHNGSSVSTALGAGLASLIMYCNNYMGSYYDFTPKGRDQLRSRDFQIWSQSLRKHGNMLKAFNNIGTFTEHEDPKIVPVWGLFREKTQSLNTAKGEDKIAELEGLVRHLCHGI
jgi:hypothetical protein